MRGDLDLLSDSPYLGHLFSSTTDNQDRSELLRKLFTVQAVLWDRGIPDLVTSDAHEGLKAALRARLQSSPCQRFLFHPQQNAQAYAGLCFTAGIDPIESGRATAENAGDRGRKWDFDDFVPRDLRMNSTAASWWQPWIGSIPATSSTSSNSTKRTDLPMESLKRPDLPILQFAESRPSPP